MTTPQEPLAQWSDSIQAQHLPRYDELPTIDLYMDQVVAVIEEVLHLFERDAKEQRITPAMINNYVKLKVLPAPVKKRYNRAHLCHLLIICMLKPVLAIPEIRDLIQLQLQNRDIRTVYDEFCTLQEQSLVQSLSALRQQIANPDACLADRTLQYAVQAHTQKMIAEKMIDLQFPDAEPSKDKKRERS